MSAPMKLTAADLTQLSAFLAAITAATTEHGVALGAYGPVEVQISGTVLAVNWDESSGEYVIDDRIGS